ncbi:unnamed protein product [Diabrotica balteata]|uniref:Platelet-derived growth factor (PDGF) family profile domain-containing protein n=1 Tax=Diabrotica balteata TaxID=107213 RepID=A0A9N9XG87_DIABA|nr:unnamed protein product [Diabrotica balteata]
MLDFRVIVIVFVTLLMCKSQNLVDEFTEHKQRVSKFVCDEPKPKVLYLRDLLTRKMLRDYEMFIPFMRPYATILHRCEGTGSCSNYNERCRPYHQETVKLVFIIKINQTIYKTFELQNHTTCTCEPLGYN